MNPRLQELREKFKERRKELSIHDLVKIESGEMEIPAWKRILDNAHEMEGGRDNNKRIMLPMPESDEIISFLDTIKGLVDPLITIDNFNYDTDVEFDGGQTDSIKRELKHEVISMLQGCIQERKLQKVFSLNDQESILDGFGNLEELYNFLLEVSGRSKEEIKNFILNEIPSFPWDNNFGISRTN